MKILMLFPYAPLPPPLDLAGTKRNLPFLLELATTNDVSVLSFGTPEQRDAFVRAYGHAVKDVRFVDPRRPRWQTGIQRLWLMATMRSPYRQLLHGDMQRALDAMVADGDYDLIHCCVPMFGYYRFPAGLPVTTDTHEIKFELYRRTAESESRWLPRLYSYWQYRLGEREEPGLWRSFDAMFATTEVDRKSMMNIEPSVNPVAVENGAGAEFFLRTGLPEQPRSMVFTGLFTHPPNVQAAEYFLDEIFPLILARVPDARIYFVGKSPPARLTRRASDRVIVTGFVDDVRPYIERAELFVIPLLSGGGIRGKALEAMAMEKAIVTTSVGVEGIALEHDQSAMFADDPELFASHVLRLFDDAQLRARLAARAGEVARQHYTWEAKGKRLDQELRRVVQSGPRRQQSTAPEHARP